jgi:hypothetical protein
MASGVSSRSPDFGYTPQYGSGPGSHFGYKSYEDYYYAKSLKDATTPGSMGYGKLPSRPDLTWNENMDRQSQFENQYSTSYGMPTGASAMNNYLGVNSSSGRSTGGGGGRVSYGGGGGGQSMATTGQPVEFYLGPAPKLGELNLNYEELGKRAMEANAPYAQQYQQWAPGAQAGTAALSNLGATMATGQLSKDMAGQIGRGAASLGYATGIGNRSGIGRNLLARDLGLSSLQVQQQGMDFLNKSSLLAQQAQQAMSPIGPTEVFGTAANQASINQQIQNQNLLNAWQSQALPGQFDITKGQFVGFQPGSYSQYRPELQMAPITTRKTDLLGRTTTTTRPNSTANWTGSAYKPQYKYG